MAIEHEGSKPRAGAERKGAEKPAAKPVEPKASLAKLEKDTEQRPALGELSSPVRRPEPPANQLKEVASAAVGVAATVKNALSPSSKSSGLFRDEQTRADTLRRENDGFFEQQRAEEASSEGPIVPSTILRDPLIRDRRTRT